MGFSLWLPALVVTGFLVCHSLRAASTPSVLYPQSVSCVEDIQENILQSKNGMFALQFFISNTSYQHLAIAYIQYNHIIVWTANRNRPITGKPCLKLGPQADLILEDTDGSLAWSANVSQVSRLELQDSGNLVLQNSNNVTIWGTFDHPTDTILPGGSLGSGKALVSAASPTGLSEGSYMLKMEPGGAVFYASFPIALPYGVWPFNPVGFESSNSLNIALQSACNHTVLNYASKGESLNLMQDGNVTAECMEETQGYATTPRTIAIGILGDESFRFVRLDVDGNLRTYIQSRTELVSDTDMFSIYFFNICKLPNKCGSLGICSSGGNCSCEETNVFEPFQSNIGCLPRKKSLCGASNQLVELPGINYFANEYMNQSSSSLEQCKSLCLSNCSCAAAFFRTSNNACYHYQEIKSLQSVSDQNILAFIKVGPGSFKDTEMGASSKANHSKTIVLATVTAGICAVIIVSVLGFFMRRHKIRKTGRFRSEEDEFLENLPGLPPRFSYEEMEEATDGFSRKLGSGAFGAVFEGQLPDGTKVAVKKLGDADRGHSQFRAEVAALGSINHVNLVRLFGFCADGTHRMLVYEYMSNLSLDCWLFRHSHENSLFLDWRKRYKIIHDTAHGLAFLHEKSRDRILHLDVKPQNILLDENFGAKLADFGLAKMMDRSQSRAFTRIRGTPGYLAPEWLLHGSATAKSDVFSFGMVLLELISGRKNLDSSLPDDIQFFPCWAMNMIKEGKMMDVVDPRLRDLADYDWEQAERVIKIAFWCIQEDERKRPSMNQVILMLEGHTNIEDPPFFIQFLFGTRAKISPPTSELKDYSTEATSSNAASLTMSLSGR